MHEEEPICSITLGDWATAIEIWSDGIKLDSALVALGGLSLQIMETGDVVAISEPGETFLDAVAKKVRVGDRLEDSMVELLANLMAETVVNAVVRRRPPQISMRLLESEPLSRFYDARKYLLKDECSESRVGKLFLRSLQESLTDRNLKWQAR